jgi:hypothetical protein
MKDDDPFALASVELCCLDLHREDMAGALFDPDQVPKHPDPIEEGTTDRRGEREVDMMHDTPAIETPFLDMDEELGL